MLYLFLIIILVLVIAIFHLWFDFYKQKKNYENRIDVLEDIISALQKKKSIQLDQLKLSDEVSKKLKESNHVISETVFDVNIDLFSQLFNKK